MDTRVSDVMTQRVVTLAPTDSIHDAAVILANNQISGAPVVEDGGVVGMLSEADLIHSVIPPAQRSRTASILDILTLVGSARSHASKHGRTVGDVMSNIVIQVSPDDSIWSAASVMETKGIKRLVVVDEHDSLVGILSRADLVRAMARGDGDIRKDVLEVVGILGEDCFENFEVDVEDGIATLTGKVDRRSTQEIAVRIAQRVPGVVEVMDGLEFQLDDSHIAPAPRKPNPLDPRRNWQSEEDAHQGSN